MIDIKKQQYNKLWQGQEKILRNELKTWPSCGYHDIEAKPLHKTDILQPWQLIESCIRKSD